MRQIQNPLYAYHYRTGDSYGRTGTFAKRSFPAVPDCPGEGVCGFFSEYCQSKNFSGKKDRTGHTQDAAWVRRESGTFYVSGISGKGGSRLFVYFPHYGRKGHRRISGRGAGGEGTPSGDTVLYPGLPGGWIQRQRTV